MACELFNINVHSVDHVHIGIDDVVVAELVMPASGNDGMIEDFGVCLGSVFAAHRKFTGIRLAPKALVPQYAVKVG